MQRLKFISNLNDCFVDLVKKISKLKTSADKDKKELLCEFCSNRYKLKKINKFASCYA